MKNLKTTMQYISGLGDFLDENNFEWFNNGNDTITITPNKTKVKIEFKEKSVYGRVLIYPVCDKANIFAGLLSTKTFTLGQLNLIASLGYQINLISL